MSWLVVKSVSKSFKEPLVLNDIHLQVAQGERLAIAGETGSGKSTLLKIISGLIQPDTGTIFFQGVRVLGPEEKLLPGHDKIGYLSQHFELLNNYRVEEVLEMKTVLPAAEAHRIFVLCDIVHLLARKTTELSGGERQRVALAKTLVANPSLLLLDEPFSNLDAIHKRAMKQTIHRLEQELGITTIMVSHDGADLLSWASRILILQEGVIIQEGIPSEVYQNPVSAYCAALLGHQN
jgi:iron(III) transport system ATP-binding protein